MSDKANSSHPFTILNHDNVVVIFERRIAAFLCLGLLCFSGEALDVFKL